MSDFLNEEQKDAILVGALISFVIGGLLILWVIL